MIQARRLAGSKVLAVGFLLAVMLAAVPAASPAHAVPGLFTVNTTNDPGAGGCNATECTLREAINAANNNPDRDLINFDIPGAGVKTISPISQLPEITEQVTINGYSQPGASANTLPNGNDAVIKIELSGASAGGATGLRIDASNVASQVVIKGLAINRFDGSGISIPLGTTDNKIEGNFIGTDPSGATDLGNGIVGVSINAVNNTVGGASPDKRNVISGNDDGGVQLGSGATGNKVEGNFIGTQKDGTSDLGNTGEGVKILGLPETTTINNTVGGATTGSANVIAFNGGGVDVFGETTGNRILSNSMFSNGGLGIDLSPNVPTPNDTSDPDTGPNNLQNFPVLSSATNSGGSTTIQGTLNSTPTGGIFTVQLFSHPPSENEGKTFLGETTATTDASGYGSFGFTATPALPVGDFVTATATSSSGDTSEFSEFSASVAVTQATNGPPVAK